MKSILVSEIGINANGDINIAKQLIDICSDLNIPYVKFQKRDIESVYTKKELDSYRESPWGTTFRQQKEGLEFDFIDYQEIDNYCKLKGNIKWFCSLWDLKSIDFVINNFPNMPFLKIPSAKLTHKEFLEKCKDTGIPLILSTGMSNIDMVKEVMEICGENVGYILGCTSSYPSPVEDINLRQIQLLKYFFETEDRKIGWSDHSGSILFPSMAVGLGAEMIEVHITLDRRMYGTDQSSSLEPEGLRKLIKYLNNLEKGLGTGLKKEIMPSEIPIIKKLRKNNNG